MHGAEVIVRDASINARNGPFGPYLYARCDSRNSEGDLKPARATARGRRFARLPVSNEPVASAPGAFGSGFDNLRAKRNPATLRGLRFDPACPDMQQRHFINS